MFPKPKSSLVTNTYAYESEPMVKATGFREYDARWLSGKEINLMNVQALGMGWRADCGAWRQAICAGFGPHGGGLQSCGDADGLFRAVRSRRALRCRGYGLAQ